MKKLNSLTVLALLLVGSTGCTKMSGPLTPSTVTPQSLAQMTGQWSSAQGVTFASPSGIALDAGGNVYMADRILNTVFKFDANGNYITQWNKNGGIAFSQPNGVAVDKGGNLYIADTGNAIVDEMGPDGNNIGQLHSFNGGSFSSPMAVVPWDDNMTFYSDAAGDVWLFDGSSPIQEFGVTAPTNGLFQSPAGMTVDSKGDLLVADSSANKVVVLTFAFNTYTSFGEAGTASGQFNGPADVKTDTTGNIYVADSGNNRIQKFDRNGNYLGQIGGLISPMGLAIGSNGMMYVTDSGNKRIVKYALN